MSAKLSSLQKTLGMTLESITHNESSWNNFLKSAAYNYKYSFKNQMLIYAQKNDATAVAEMRTWNKYGRYVDKGTPPISIIDTNNQVGAVYDYSDTNSWYGHEVTAWQYPQHVKVDIEKIAIDTEKFYSKNMPEILSQNKEFVVASIKAITLNRCKCSFDEADKFANVNLLSEVEIKLAGDYIQKVSLKALSEIKQITKNMQVPLTDIRKLSETESNENKDVRSNNNEERYNTEGTINSHVRSRDTSIHAHGRPGGSVGNTCGGFLANGHSPKRESTRENGGNGQVGQRSIELSQRGVSNGDILHERQRAADAAFTASGQGSTNHLQENGTGVHQEKQADIGDVENGQRNRGSTQARHAATIVEREDLQRHNKYTAGARADIRGRAVLGQLSFIQTPLTEKVSGVSDLGNKSVSTELITRCKILVHKQDTKLWITKGLKLSYLDDYINKFAQGEEYSYARYAGGEKADVEVLRTLLLIKESATKDTYKQEAGRLIDKLGIISKAVENTLDPNKSITLFTVGAFYEVYSDEAVFMADKFDLPLTKNKTTGRELVGIPHYAVDNYKAALESIGIHATIVDESVVPKVEDKSLQKQQAGFTLETTAPDYTYSKVIKFQENIRAIAALKLIESENRQATDAERAVLTKYAGWGGLSDSFEEKSTRYATLKKALNESEYTAARESTLSAFYTQPFIAEQMFQALTNFGFEGGTILEPSCGSGVFLGALPTQLQSKVEFSAIEIDSLSGRLTKATYPNASVQITGFENAELTNDVDVAIGNVPFGNWKVNDAKYNKHNFMIHDYFFAKALDHVRPNGVLAFITSKGTLDKDNPSLRRYLASRAELIGAIRLPTKAFKGAGTDITADIIFLQKNERMKIPDESWLHLNTNDDGVVMNQYFIDNPHMVLGEMKMVSSQFGMDSACIARENEDLYSSLKHAIAFLDCDMQKKQAIDKSKPTENADVEISANPNVRNYSFTSVDNQAYYREDNKMTLCNKSTASAQRILDYIPLRDAARKLIDMQLDGYSDGDIGAQQKQLMSCYKKFVKNNGIVNSTAAVQTLRIDASFNLISGLENIDENKNVISLADMFYKRTINKHEPLAHVDTSSEALAVSLGEKAKIDIDYMHSLTGFTEQQMLSDLNGIIFLNPFYGVNSSAIKYIPADEYLSGNIREKLLVAENSAKFNSAYEVNVKFLKQVMPQDLTASEIFAKLGSTWIPDTDITQFIKDTLKPFSSIIEAKYSPVTSEWTVTNKASDRSNVLANNRYGTSRANAYGIIENMLNLRDVRIYDLKEVDGKETRVLNVDETEAAQYKQAEIKEAFTEWLWQDMSRRDRLCKAYNETFNPFRTREFDGSHLVFNGMNTGIQLEPHQKNAVARILYGGNTLLAHVVGAGKTYEMIAAAQESKRLGLCNKSMIVVPNHLTEQFASDYLELYPSANILTSTKKDFEPNNRKKFCGRIATGDYDAVIIGHSQFEKIPLSAQQQEKVLQEQINEIKYGIKELRSNNGENFTIKQMEKLQKQLEFNFKKLSAQERKDNLVTFEQLGVDKLFVDEAHNFKNLFLHTKMRNVAGVSQTAAQKSTDLYMKCKYLDELTGGKGTVFATGTPISNSMSEMYTLQRYLQNHELTKRGLANFDAWASTFGETETVIELSPEGKGIRPKTRFSKFNNLPELMTMFKQFADVQTADMLNLDVPSVKRERVLSKASPMQTLVLDDLARLADKVRNRKVQPYEANMLTITNDGRKLALDIRLMGDEYEKDENSKVDKCTEKVFSIWRDTSAEKLTQIVFCDLSTPGKKGVFNIYDEVKNELIAKGIPKNEIAFIHDANTETQKAELFARVRSGSVRVLLGSTAKAGAGTNVQDKLIALHHLDCRVIRS